MEPIILTVDTGIDDFIMIVAAGMRKDKFKIEGVCASYGNCNLYNVINNTFQALDIAKCSEVSVYKGSERPLHDIKVRDATDVHGNNGLGNLVYKEIEKKIEEIPAEDFFIDKVNEKQNEITLIATGPLTDIAKAIRKDKNFPKNLKRLVILGGGIEEGNITEYAEFNIYQDPEAAKIVFESGIKDITMIGLDVANKNIVDEKMKKIISKINTKEAKFIYELLSNLEEGILYDPITICYLIDNDIIKFNPLNIQIETKGVKRGKTKVNKMAKDCNCNVAYAIDVKKTKKILLESLFKIKVCDNEI